MADSSRLPSVCSMITYPISGTTQTLILTKQVLTHFNRHRQGRKRKEAGGQLFARFAGSEVRIVTATGPRRSDLRAFGFFRPNRPAEQREIHQMFRRGLNYVGDWHTHPEDRPTASRTDSSNISDIFRRSVHQLSSLVLIIVGGLDPPDGLYVATCDGWKIRVLSNPAEISP
jgi:integrative and conjugative element protein (TIGR02256 family)